MNDKTQRALADEMDIAYPRVSEALHGKRTGYRYIRPIIEKLGGNLDDFEVFLNEMDKKIK